jgi:hypothetical protein
VKTTRLAITFLALTGFVLAAAAQAAPVVHDSIGEFASIVGNQGRATNGSGGNTQLTNVSAARGNLGNRCDGKLNTA